MDNEKELTIEELLEKIEEISTLMESGELSVEESFDAYEKGIKLIRKAAEKIDEVEKKIRILSEEDAPAEE